MLVAEKMNRLTVVVMKDDMEPVFEEIAKVGVLHLTRIEEIDEWARELECAGAGQLSDEYLKRQRRIERLVEEVAPGDLKDRTRSEEIRPVDLGEADKQIATIEATLEPLLSARKSLTEQLNELKGLLTGIGTLMPSGVPVRALTRSTFLSSAIGTIEEAQLTKLRRLLESVPSVVLPYRRESGRLHLVCVVLKKDGAGLERSLKEVSFKKTEGPADLSKVSAEAESGVANEIAKLEHELARVARDTDSARRTVSPQLIKILEQVEATTLLLRIKDYCRLTDKTCVFSGWVPRDKTDELVVSIKEKTEGRAIVSVVQAEQIAEVTRGKIEVPVLFKHTPFLKPFEILVAGYGIPAYRMVDPTVFVAITFLAMFGMMFGDAGHGLILLAAGLILGARYERLRDAGKLIAYCGISSVFFGILYGSFFGLATVLPTVWVKPLEGIMDLFRVAIGFGVAVVSLGIILNVVNSIRTHSFLDNLFDTAGPLVGLMYWAGVGAAVKFMMSSPRLLHPVLFVAMIVVPLTLLFMKGPILKFMGRQHRMFPEGVGTYAMEEVVEIMEILMGYLANTVSFIRVAAFGLAHAGLFVAVFSLAEVVASKPGGMVLSWLVLVLGNIGIILLEGLVVTIQALRLEYYEFFGKFFRSTGSKYEPVGVVASFAGSNN